MAVPSETAEDGPSVEGLDCSRVLTDVIKRHQDSHRGPHRGAGHSFALEHTVYGGRSPPPSTSLAPRPTRPSSQLLLLNPAFLPGRESMKLSWVGSGSRVPGFTSRPFTYPW